MSATSKRFLAVLTAAIIFVSFAVYPLLGCTFGSSPATSFTVRFDSNGGSAVESQTVAKGELVKRPTDPTKDGRVFVNWYKDTDLTTLWLFDKDTVTRNMVLHAGWRVPGSNVIEDPVDDPDDNADDDDWLHRPDDDDDNNNDNNNNGDNNNNDNNDDNGDGSSVTATFNVGYDARKEGLCNPPAQVVKSGAKLTAPTPTRSGYTLSGWYVENGDTLWKFDSDKITTNTTLFAKWTVGGGSYDPDERADYTPSMNEPNTLYIHYRRSDGNYDGWAVWAWRTGANGVRYASVKTDASGTVIAINLSAFGNDTTVNFIVAILSADLKWGEKDGDNNTMTLSSAQKIGSSYHWYVDEDNVANGKAYLAKNIAGSSYEPVTEPLRASRTDLDRSYAQGLDVQSTVSGWDEVGVGYQIFVASFCDSDGDGMGDLRGIISRLDYLKKDLNVDVLWLTPIQSSDSSHGYDCYDYYAIDPKFGTNADYRELVSKAHKAGIKVIMDLVVNHTSRKNEWFIKSKKGVIETVTYQDGTTETVNYRDFYRWKNSRDSRYCSAGDGWYYYSSFNDSMPELNYDYQPVRKAMADVAAYWMGFGLDGFRMDAIKHVYMWGESDDTGCQKGPQNDPGWEFNVTKNVEFFKEFNHRLKSKYPHCFLLGEQLSGDERYVAPFYQGMDSLFDFNTYYNLPKNINTGSASTQADKFNDNAKLYRTNRGDRPINSMISSNHDIKRLYDLEYINGDVNKMKLYFAVIMTMPGISWIYYGDEIGMTGGGKGVGSKDDDDRKWRQPMRWTSDWQNACNTIPGIDNFHCNGNTVSVADQMTDRNSLLSYVKNLTALRDAYPTLASGEATCSAYNGMLKIVVKKSPQTVTVYHNFTGSTVTAQSAGDLVFGSNNVAAYGTTVYVA